MSAIGRVQRLKSIGRALEIYLKRSRDHTVMMERENADFERGKRHLANIMGWDPSLEVKQEDVDSAIEYLFPSGLNQNARPIMKPPEQIMPSFTKFSFDIEGRPADTLFYTLKPKFYSLLSNCGLKAQRLSNYYDERTLRGLDGMEKTDFVLADSVWLSQEELSKKLGERVNGDMYANLIFAFEHLCSLPYAHLEKDFILEYRTSGVQGKERPDLFGRKIPEIFVNEETNSRYTCVSTDVKNTVVETKVIDAGSGKFLIDGHPHSVFRSLLARENLLAPLLLTGKLGKVDVEATVVSGPGGLSVIPRAVRYGASLGIAALYPETKQLLRFAGLLTRDPRKKERKKPSQPGARAKFIWKRR